MDFKNFGQLIRQLRKDLDIKRFQDYSKDLRKEQESQEKQGREESETQEIGHRDRGLTQEELAGLLGKKRRYIIDLENGNRSCIRPEELTKLADIFGLTEMERKEFFLAGNGVSNTEIFREERGIETMQTLIDILRYIRLPAFLTSPFTDFIAINLIVAELYGITPERIKQFQKARVPSNLIWFILSTETGFLELNKEHDSDWENIIISNMQFFRRTSLHYRAHSYWTKLTKYTFLQDKMVSERFKKYWDLARQRENLDCNIGRHYKLFINDDIGHIEFLSLVTEEVATSGSLYLTVYIPTNRNTFEKFAELAKRHEINGKIEIIKFLGNWPLNDDSQPGRWSFKIVY